MFVLGNIGNDLNSHFYIKPNDTIMMTARDAYLVPHQVHPFKLNLKDEESRITMILIYRIIDECICKMLRGSDII